MGSASLRVSCLCGAISQLIALDATATTTATTTTTSTSTNLSLCHCDSCRHSSGQLCASYRPVAAPGPTTPLPSGLSEYGAAPDGWTRYFCSTCGCHVLRCRKGANEWEVATGVVVESEGIGADEVRCVNHVHVADTKDGGSAVWLPEVNGRPMSTPDYQLPPQSTNDAPTETPNESLPASCACGKVRFRITRPGPQSRTPRSNIADLLLPYATTDPAVTSNPADLKWWIRGAHGNKYLGGTCACRSCRLASGFEVQFWTFVPRANIFFHPSNGSPDLQLDFDALPAGTALTSYASSEGVLREFCGTCGATVFWHDRWRPDLIDVSVGLLRAGEGARAESWVEWWTERVSFTEETEKGRAGVEAERARGLVSSLEKGLLQWGETK